MATAKLFGMSGRVRQFSVVATTLLCLTALSVSQALGGSYERGVRSTVLIQGPRSLGSGVLVDGPRRLVATAAHVVNDNLFQDGVVLVSFAQLDGKGQVIAQASHYNAPLKQSAIRARVVAKDDKADLAIIQLESLPAGAEPAPLAAESPLPGTKVFVIGHSDIDDGVAFSYCTGYVRNVARRTDGVRKVLHATPTNPGDSGGPLFNERDEVVGLVSRGTGGMSTAQVRHIARQVVEEAKNAVPQASAAPRREPQVRDYAVDVSDVHAMLKRIPMDGKAAPIAANPQPQDAKVKTFAGKLTKADPMNPHRAGRHQKMYEVALKAGQKVVIDLKSGNGQAGPQNPGYFDTFLRVEDAKGAVLAENDDGGEGHNSRVEIQPAQDRIYRIIVSSFAEGATGDFILEIR